MFLNGGIEILFGSFCQSPSFLPHLVSAQASAEINFPCPIPNCLEQIFLKVVELPLRLTAQILIEGEIVLLTGRILNPACRI